MVVINDETVNTILQLNNSDYQFALGGSRYLETNSPNSDWDFYAEMELTIKDFLLRLGFHKLNDNDYPEEVFHKGEVQVCVTPNFNMRKAVHRALKESIENGFDSDEIKTILRCGKSQAEKVNSRAIWRALENAYQFGLYDAKPIPVHAVNPICNPFAE